MTNITAGILARDPHATTPLAAALNSAMTCPIARANYRAIYGVEWAPLGDGSCIAHVFASGTDLADLVADLEDSIVTCAEIVLDSSDLV